ncbi:DEAD/DEAH box helicase [Aquimarina pacifica]|uniref:DEAD/DEAH box helicase n=1 Tax=Aquimarina pacifica TaxID=1296415 RepID=UPI00047191E2|nr:AAA domain-containing protein [Aquimarina pacifica]
MYIEKVVSYYQDCYKQEFRDNDVLNFLGTKVDKRFFLSQTNSLYREEDTTFMKIDFGEELYKYLEINRKEKTFISCSFFITGKLTFLGKRRTICAPLIVTPVSLEINNDGLYHIDYNFSENRTNDALLNLLKGNFDLDDSFLLEIKSLVNEQSPEKQNIEKIAKKLKEYLDVDTKALEELPKLLNGDKLKSHVKSSSLKLLPVVAIGVVEKSKSNRNVLHEIEEIKDGHLFNETLHSLFSRNKNIHGNSSDQKASIYVPSNLSEPQLDIIRGVKNNDVTVVVGPPGTGKSYTIASLAIDLVYHQQSVLICSKSDQAVDVLQNKIIHDLGIKGLSIRAGSGRGYKAKLKKKIESILRFRKSKGGDFYIPKKKKEIEYAERKIQEISDEILERESQEIKNAKLFLEHRPSFFKRIKRNYVSKQVLKSIPFWQLIDLLHHYIHQKNKLIKEIISLQYADRVTSLLKDHRSTFQDLLRLAKSPDPEVRDQLFEAINFDAVLSCLPIWITKSTDVSEVLPLKNDVFDVVIIDEASQCDIATMIPILARAKKIVIVGDPKQLRHVSFLSKAVMEKTASTYGLEHEMDVSNYRETSFLDYVLERIKSQESIHFLDEHYRSLPDIIRYSNHKFYENQLKVMSGLYIHKKQSSLEWIQCSGSKKKDGVNLEEAHKVLEEIERLVEEEKEIASNVCTTIGVLSPFRDQVNYLKKKMEEIDLTAIRKHKIAVGTPFEFQGEERDLMLITFTIDNDTSASVFQYLDREDVFNVSITRAKQKQLLYYSFDAKNFKNRHLLIEYLSETRIRDKHVNDTDFIDNFATEVFEELIQLGIKEQDILINYPLAGYVMDILLTYNNRTVCIDLVGYPGSLEKTFSIEQYKTLFRIRVPIITIPYAYWLYNKKDCLAYISKKVRITK